MGVVLAFVIITAIFWYRDYTRKIRYQNAVDFYGVVMNANLADEKNVAEVRAFISEHGNDVYSELAALSLAKQFVSEKKYQEAADLLNGSLGAAKDSILDDIVRLRIARLDIELRKFDDAAAVLNAVKNTDSFRFEVTSLKGDAAYASGDLNAAFKYYDEALSYAKADEDTTVVKMKRDSLNAVKGVPAAKNAAQVTEPAAEAAVKDTVAEDAAETAAKTVEAEASAKQ